MRLERIPLLIAQFQFDAASIDGKAQHGKMSMRCTRCPPGISCAIACTIAANSFRDFGALLIVTL